MTILEACVMRAPGLVSGVEAWGAGSAPAQPESAARVPFVCVPSINQRFAIWQGDITTLEVDAIANTTNETLTECDTVSERILQAAGPELKEEIITKALECRPGEVVVTPGFGLRCRHIIHTVCPKYTAKYHTSAETLLQNCYMNVLNSACSLGARSLALPVLNSPKRNFPPELAAHVALRTVRRFLEQSSCPQVVVLSVCESSHTVHCALAALYFPRCPPDSHNNHPERRIRIIHNPHEHNEDSVLSVCESSHTVHCALAALYFPRCPPDSHNNHPERRIRIIHNPHEHNEDSAEDDTSIYDEDTAVEAAAAFARPDTQRLLPDPSDKIDINRRRQLMGSEQYERLLRRARMEDLSEISGIGCLYQSGVDRLGRPVVIFIGKWFPIGDIDLDKALLYLIKLLDPIVRGDYVIAYFHTLASSTNHPPFSWLKEVYTVLPYKYKKNLKAFYIVHPTFWTKMMTWWFTTFMAPAIKAKVHNLPGVEYLYSVMARDQLEVPAFVTEYDMTINGLHYFQPETNTT